MSRPVALTALVALLGCTPSHAAREACYASADSRQASRAMAECKATGWTDCPARNAIRQEARDARAACP